MGWALNAGCVPCGAPVSLRSVLTPDAISPAALRQGMTLVPVRAQPECSLIVYLCTGVPMYWCTGAPVHTGRIHLPSLTRVPVCGRVNFSIFKVMT